MKDITLQGAALIIASRNDAEIGALMHLKYAIRNRWASGMRCHGRSAPSQSLMGDTHPPSLILSAGWIQGQGLTLDIIFLTPALFHISRGIVTDPIEHKVGHSRWLAYVEDDRRSFCTSLSR